jgi:uncharacterized OsmC-like protein
MTDGTAQLIVIPPKPSGFGSSLNGGEVLFLALATCYCNDLYREARRLDIQVESVEVEVQGEFGQPGEPAKNVTYRVKVAARAGKEETRQMVLQTDRMAEIHNTLRVGAPVELAQVEVAPAAAL